MFAVIVTYGTQKGATYARVPSRDSAEKLKECAIQLGYVDATVEYQPDVPKVSGTGQRGPRPPRRVAA